MLSARVDLGHADVEPVVYGYLSKRFPKVENWNAETSLLESGIIDSLGVLELMGFLEEKFGITLEEGDFDPKHLATPGQLVQFILERRRN